MIKKYFANNLGTLICLISISLIIVLAYLDITKTFYQQDEWLGYGLYLAKGAGMIFQSTGGFLGIIFGQGRVLTNLLYFLFYKYSPLNVLPIAIFAIIFHTINTLIVFFLSKKLFKRNLPAFLGSLFFALSSVSYGAVTWPAASINTLPSTTLILISLIFYFRYMGNFKQKWLIASFVFVYLSQFFKETGVFLFLLLPIFSLFYKRQNIIAFLKVHWYFIAAAVLIVAFRISGFRTLSGQEALFLTGTSKYFLDAIAVRSILYPLTSFSLTIIPPEPFLNFARYITNVYYPFIPEGQFILVAQTVVLDFLASVLSTVIVVISLALLKVTDSKTRKPVIFWFAFLFASFLPYIIISKSYSYLESRYYYLGSAAWGLIFAWMANLVIEKIKFKYVKIVFLVIFTLFIYIQVKTLTADTKKIVSESQIRTEILNQVSAIKPRLNSKKNIFYITGDTDYYLPGNKVPFQQGFGYTLLVWYGGKSQYPNDFFENTSLFEIGKNGYYETNGYGFGYFSDKKLMKKILKDGNLDVEVISLEYNSKTNSLIKIQNY